MNYTLIENTVLLFWDNTENFDDPLTQQKIGPGLFKDVIRVDSLDRLKQVFKRYKDNEQKFLFLIHLFHKEDNKGYYLFKSSKIMKEFPRLHTYLISSAPKRKIYGTGSNELDVYSYDNFHEKIGSIFIPQTKREILGEDKSPQGNKVDSIDKQKNDYPFVDYAIITALYKDEFEEVEKLFDWNKNEDIKTKTKVYRIGSLKNNPSKKIVAATPTATGMVDSAIIATQILDFFRPKYLLMSGVCGGKQSANFGDIVLAKKIFTFQKGKVSEIRGKNGNNIELYDRRRNKIAYDHLYDEKGNNIKVRVEKFEIEHDSIIEIDPLVKDKIEPHINEIEVSINKYLEPFNKKITIHFDSMACSTMVINRHGFFEDNIKSVDRNTVAVEMESYGVARACKFANNGETKCIIFKSIMDKMKRKNDRAKKFAAHTSAQFLKHLIYNNLLD